MAPARVSTQICLWNATSICNKELELSHFLNNILADLALVTETWLDSSRRLALPGYSIVRRDSSQPHVGGGLQLPLSIILDLPFYRIAIYRE